VLNRSRSKPCFFSAYWRTCLKKSSKFASLANSFISNMHFSRLLHNCPYQNRRTTLSFGMGRSGARTARWPSPLPMGDGSCRPSQPRHRWMRVRHLQERQRTDRQTVGVAGGHLSGGEMAAALTKALGGSTLQRRAPRFTEALAFPAPTISAYVPVQRDFNDYFAATRQPGFSPR